MEHARGNQKSGSGSRPHSGALSRLARTARAVLPWLGLMAVSATVAHAMQVGVESISVTVDTPSTSSRFAEVSARRPQRIVVVISFVDASGNDQQLECTTTADRVASDTLFVYLDDVRAVQAELCEPSPTHSRTDER
jgi:hypothetical protein